MSLAYGPEEAGELGQRSRVIAPLIAQRELLGYLYADLDGRFGRLRESDRDLLGMLASQAAVALDNAQWSQSLEQKVAQRTEELQASKAVIEQRANELAIINRIQEGMAAELNFQAIVDLVGDKLVELFGAGTLVIGWLDDAAGLIRLLYACEHGLRRKLPPVEIAAVAAGKRYYEALAARQAVLWTSQAEYRDWGLFVAEGTEMSRSGVLAPIFASDRTLGFISLENMERDNAYGDADVRLLSTVGASMGVALENARLFDETQRLYKESEQRAAELAIINSVQAALAAELNMQGIYDAVGDKIREIFHQADVGIRICDPPTNLIHYPYVYEGGQRIAIDSHPLRERGIAAHVLRTREMLLVNENVEEVDKRYGSYTLPGTQQEKSALYVPLVVGDQARGLISLSDMEREHAFSDSDVRLLQTLANSMSVALENARLFAETQQRAAELATVNTVSQQLGSNLELSSLIERVGEQVRTVFKADIAYVALVDRRTGIIEFPYQFGEKIDPLRLGEGLTSRIIESGRALIINDDAARRGQDLGARVVGRQARSYLGVPIVVGGTGEGVLSVQSTQDEGRYGADDQRLLETIAANVGVAIQNARLFNATREALARQTATAEMLRVISSSPTDVQPVFDAIVTTAVRLLAADSAFVMRRDGNTIHVEAAATPAGLMSDVAGLGDIPLDAEANFPSRAMLTMLPLHLPDWGAIELPEHQARIREAFGINAALLLPMVRHGQSVGVLSFARRRAGAYTPAEIALAESFRDQALIAIENARLFNETQEALARQTATSDVLRVISESPTDVQPVLDAVAERAGLLCHADGSRVWLIVDGQLRAMTNYGPAFTAPSGVEVLPLRRTSIAGRAILERRIIHHEDAQPLIDTEYPDVREIQRRLGFHTVLNVPLLREGEEVGVISLLRIEVRPFTPAEIALVATFADQAVIAIENVRLWNETKEALEQQTATGEVLQVISSSVADTQPVFEKILDSCQRLIACSDLAVLTVDQDNHGAPGFDPRHGRPEGRTEIQADPHRPDNHRGGGAGAPRDALSRCIVGGWGSRGDSPHGSQDRQFFMPGCANDVAGQWCWRFLRRPHARGPPMDDVYGAGDRPAADLRRPGRDRDPERAPLQGGAGSARRCRSRQRGQELVPRHDEPRDPHADERGDRHERPAARHEARHRAARLCVHHPRFGRRAADHHQRHPRLLEDRSRPDGHRSRTRSTCAIASSPRSTSSARAPRKSTSTSPTCSRATSRARSAAT